MSRGFPWGWGATLGVLMLGNPSVFGAASFAALVALGLAWLLARADHDSGPRPPALRIRKKVKG